MSSSLATAQHLKKVHLHLEDSDINFLTPCLSSLSHSQSLQELSVWCDASGVFSGCAAHTCMHSHTHKHHMSEHSAPITCPEGKYVHAVLTRAGTNTEIWLRIFVPNMPRIFEYSVLDDFRYWLALYKHCGC